MAILFEGGDVVFLITTIVSLIFNVYLSWRICWDRITDGEENAKIALRERRNMPVRRVVNTVKYRAQAEASELPSLVLES